MRANVRQYAVQLVERFSVQMDQELTANAPARGEEGYKTVHVTTLLAHLKEEVKELEEAVTILLRAEAAGVGKPELLLNVQEEAADVGNLAMMVADNVQALKKLCLHCKKKPVAYYGGIYCGSACCALAEEERKK